MAEFCLMWLGEKQHLSIKLASSFQWTYYILQRVDVIELGRKDHCLGSRPKERKGSMLSHPLSRVSQLTNQPLSFDGSPRQQVRILTQRSSS